jgi:serine protease AprX
MFNTMTAAEKQAAYQLIYAGVEPEPGRFTSDIPINAEVWFAYWRVRFELPQELLLTPHLASGVAMLRKRVSDVLTHLTSDGSTLSTKGYLAGGKPFVAANESHVLVNVSFDDLLRLLPLTSWWNSQVVRPLSQGTATVAGTPLTIRAGLLKPNFVQWVSERVWEQFQDEQSLRMFKLVGQKASKLDSFGKLNGPQQQALRRVVNVAGLYAALLQLNTARAGGAPQQTVLKEIERTVAKVLKILAEHLAPADEDEWTPEELTPLWSVALNRPAAHAVVASRKTVKADAAIRVFDTGGSGVRWAIIDSGIDATHPALAKLDKLLAADFVQQSVPASKSRVVKTLDFTRFAQITSGMVSESLVTKLQGRVTRQQLIVEARKIEASLRSGQMLDWAAIEPLLEIPHQPAQHYRSPHDTHGTHVAGILGANWSRATYTKLNIPPGAVPIELAMGDVCGVCPQIELLDLRVFDEEVEEERGGEGSNEFAIIAALQYVRYLNHSKDRQYVHGVNMSLSLKQDVRSFACGSTPVCMEVERLVGNGVVVVAAAGNFGYDDDYGATHLGGAYRGQSITDPGNAPSAITVGSTHRTDPYRYGISYFSSHGPTGDGREKPDLVAPGEKIVSTVPGAALGDKDGTSMAAPHVSGVAALLLSRNTELMGQPNKVKDILCRTASDLGRGKVFQGCGLVDALRALQAV